MSKKKQKVNLVEEDKKPAAEAGVEQGAADAQHDDAAQDKALIKQMLTQHLGEEPNEEVMKNADEAYMAACESGLKHEEACEHVAKAMKMAKIMAAHEGKKAEADKAEAPKAEEKPECKDGEECTKEEKAKEAEEVKESAKPAEDSEIVRLRGENAALKETIRKRELSDTIDAKLAETKLPRSVTKTIRESLTACRSDAEVDQKLKLFLEGFKAGSESGQGWIEGAEKTENVKAGVSFADCIL